MKRIVIIGATSSIAEHCARQWVEEPTILTLVGRNQEKLDVIACDLRLRSSISTVISRVANFEEPQAIEELAKELSCNQLDIVLIAHGYMPDQMDCENDLDLCKKTLEISGVSPVLFVQAFVKYMHPYNHGTLAVIGSVAGDRGRKSNYVYGSAKGLIERYVEGLQHKLFGTHLKVVLIKPGPTDTPMTANKQLRTVATPRDVASNIIDGINKGAAVVYAPKKWRLIMAIIANLPSFVFYRLDI